MTRFVPAALLLLAAAPLAAQSPAAVAPAASCVRAF